jgi:hypothetical protein
MTSEKRVTIYANIYHASPKNDLIELLDDNDIPHVSKEKLMKYLIFYCGLELEIVEKYVPHVFDIRFNSDGLYNCKLTINKYDIFFYEQMTVFNIKPNVREYLTLLNPIPYLSEREFNELLKSLVNCTEFTIKDIANYISESDCQIDFNTFEKVFRQWELDENQVFEYANLLDICLDRVKDASLMQKYRTTLCINNCDLKVSELETIFEPFEVRGLELSADNFEGGDIASFMEDDSSFFFLNSKIGPEKMAELFAKFLRSGCKTEFVDIGWIISFLAHHKVDLSIAFPFTEPNIN